MSDAFRRAVRTKLLAAFLLIELLLVALGAIGLVALREVEQRATIYQAKGIARPHAQQPSSSIGSFGIPLGDDCRGSG
jgi:hypothetical protein